MPGETRKAVFAQPQWLARVPTDRRLPEAARVVHVGCGTSFHAAQSGGRALQALEAVLSPPDADVMVCVSHEGETALTLEAARAFTGPVWLVTGTRTSPLAELAAEVVVATPEPERSWCHTVSYTCAVAAIDALHGLDISALPAAVEAALAAPPLDSDLPERVLVVGSGRAWATAQEAVLKLREGAWVAAEAFETEQLLHGYLAGVEPGTRAFVLEGEGRGAERAHDLVGVLTRIGVEPVLLPTTHPVVDIVPFHLLTLAVADARGIDPDSIRRNPGSPLAEATGAAYPHA